MKIFVTGPDGNVGRELVKLGCESLRVDVTSKWKVRTALKLLRPDLIIHCAAFTDVERTEADYKPAHNVNVMGTGYVRMYHKGPMIYISSDHVFDGKRGNYKESDRLKPVNAYGMTKMAGEAAMDVEPHELDKIVRTSTLFGGLEDTKFWSSYFKLRMGDETIETTQIYRSFFWVTHFAECLMDLTTKLSTTPRVIHISGTEIVHYYDFFKVVADVFEFDPKLVKARNVKLKGVAPRPYKGGLNVKLAQKSDIPVKSFRDGLKVLRERIGKD